METAGEAEKLPSDTQRIVLEELDRCRERIVERIARARKLTDEEVYHAGAALNQVVQKAQAYMTLVNERMSAVGADADVEKTLVDIQKIAQDQDREVSSALEHLADIAKAGQKIRELSGASRLLALNARVESARFGGEGGRAFNVIADEMRELSVLVESTNTMVSKLAKKLQDALPLVQEQTQAMGTRVESLVSTLGTQNEQLQAVFQDSVAAGSEALEGILASAHDGLGHLQFQDIMIQDLEGIERFLKTSRSAVASALSALTEPGQEAENAFLGTIGAELEDDQPDHGLENGEVLLF